MAENASVHSDEDTLAPMREASTMKRQAPPGAGQRRGVGQQAPGPGGGLTSLGAGAARKSIAVGARGASVLSYALGGGGGTRRRSRSGDPGGQVRLENTYRMQPKAEERFSRCQVQPLVQETMEDQLSGFAYPTGSGGGAAASAAAGRKACELAHAIRDRVKEAGFDRYKLVVTACLFQRGGVDCAAAVATRAIWAVDCGDAFAECRYQNKSLMAVVTIHAFYFE